MNQKERYNRIWQCGNVQKPEIWSTWEIIKNFKETRNLEIGPGNYPRIPVKGGFFIDISEIAISKLKQLGAKVSAGSAESLPFESGFFDLVVATDVLEHIEDDKKALFEIARVLKPKGFFLLSVPLRKELFSEFDSIAGHRRRYEIKELINLLSIDEFKIVKYRPMSLYFKAVNVWCSTGLCKKLYKNKKSSSFFHLPKCLVNSLARTHAFLDGIRNVRWKNDIESLMNYNRERIMILCQK